jgi:hypothetical protein
MPGNSAQYAREGALAPTFILPAVKEAEPRNRNSNPARSIDPRVVTGERRSATLAITPRPSFDCARVAFDA